MLCTILTAGHRHDFLVSSRWRPIISMINCRQSVRKHFFQLYYIIEKPQDKTSKGTSKHDASMDLNQSKF